MPKEHNIEVSSEQFLGRLPAKLIKRGTIVAILAMGIILSLGFIVNFNQTITAKTVITSNPPPITLLSKVNGYIDSINVSSGDIVHKNKLIAILKSPGNSNHILYIDSLLSRQDAIFYSVDDFVKIYKTELQLGPEIQESYNDFIHSYISNILHYKLEIDKSNINNLTERGKSTISNIRTKQKELSNLREKLKTANKNLERYEELYNKGALSDSEIENRRNFYIDSENQLIQAEQSLENLRINSYDIINRKNTSVSLYEQKTIVSNSKLDLDRQILISKINQWKDTYTFISPMDGIVSTYDSWSKNQEVDINESFLTIAPINDEQILAKCQVPIINTGKLAIGQEVIIHLENYPYQQYGAITGVIKTISDIPKSDKEPYYMVDVSLKNLKTSYGQELDFKQNMKGTGYIIVEKLSLVNRILFSIRKTLSSNG